MNLMASRALSRLARVTSSSSRAVRLPAAAAAPGGNRFFSSETPPAPLTREGVTDSHGLLQFKTLHEMNHYASIAFRDNPLFGTYRAPLVEENVVKDQADAKGTFEWMTYGEYGGLVDRCRTVLKDIGEFEGGTVCSLFVVAFGRSHAAGNRGSTSQVSANTTKLASFRIIDGSGPLSHLLPTLSMRPSYQW